MAICEQDGVPFLPWETFDDVREALETLDTLPGPVGPERCPGWRTRDARAARRVSPLARRPRRTSPSIFELIAACELEDDGVVEVDEDDVTVGFGRHGFDPELDTMLVFDRDELVAWAEIYRRRGEADVRPSHRGRGIGLALLGWIEGRAPELGDPEVGQTKTDANAAARELFLANGYEPSWTSWMIRIALDEPPPPPEVPPGISIRPYRASDARDVHRVIDAAFTEWPGTRPGAVRGVGVRGHRAPRVPARALTARASTATSSSAW